MKKTLIWVLVAIISGIALGRITFDKYQDIQVEKVISYNDKMYALYYGVYDSVEDMNKDMSSIERYIYINVNNKVYSYIAITEKKENIKKIKKIYDSKNIKTSIVKINIDNDEFIQNINEYEKLLDATEEESSLLIIENQILSCYEKLVVKDE